MARSKNYAYADLSVEKALYLKIDGTEYEVTQYNASFAVNEIPQAQCLLALGRDASSKGAGERATIHKHNVYSQMVKAEVYFRPKGEFHPDGTKWPEGETVIFRGYFVGFAYRKMLGKIQVVANLVHWLVDLTCSSCLSSVGHVANPTQLNVAAVFRALKATGAAQGHYVSLAAPQKLTEPNVSSDVWVAIKNLFCALANLETNPVARYKQCDGGGDWNVNARALEALKYIEGGGDCPFTPRDGGQNYSVPLSLDLRSKVIVRSVASSIAGETMEQYANTTFWDKLVAQFCSMFGMAVVPMVERALVIADLPAYNGDVWKTIDHTEYDSFDMTAMLERPLRGVGVVSYQTSQTKAGMQENAGSLPLVGGCYVEQSVAKDDGMIQLVSPPHWLRAAQYMGTYIDNTTGDKVTSPSQTAGSDDPGKPPIEDTLEKGTFGQELNELYRKYAHWVYVNNMLRGRTGAFSGKLRFDIAPGSILRIKQRGEKHLKGKDDLATTLIAAVARVTITINAEAGMAATTFQLGHIRREKPENSKPRTSVSQHPLFKKQIHGSGKHGSPLLPKYDIT